jgi:putative transposase
VEGADAARGAAGFYTGPRYDRDVNAARNILTAGQAVTACGADVRHSGTSRVQSAVKQERRPVTAGIPVLQGGE